MSGVTKAKPEPTWLFHLRNASDVPVYDVVILFQVDGHSLGNDNLDVLPPGDEPMDRLVPEHVRREARSYVEEYGTVIRPVLTFRDASGQTWRRTADGRLSAVDLGVTASPTA